jgi:hypothetical protein
VRARAWWATAAAALACLGACLRAPAAPASDPGPWLIFDVANSVYTTNPGGNFVVEVKSAGQREIVYRAVWGAQQGVWLPQAVNLRAYAGQSVKLRLQTIAAYCYSNACFLQWGRPRVVLGPLDAATPPQLLADLTEAFRLGRDCRRYILDAEASGPLKTADYDFTGGYFDGGQAGPWSEPALFGHPFCFGFHGWAGYEFDVTLPPRPDTPPPAAAAAPPPPFEDRGAAIPVFTWEQQVYRGAEGGFAAFDPAAMRLETVMPRTEAGLGYAFAGFETRDCDTLWLALETDRYERWAQAYGEMGDNGFAGVVLDYHTPRGYSRRVWLHLPAMKPAHPELRCERRAPTWHMDLSRPSRILEANWEQRHADLPPGSPPGEEPATRIVGLDLRQWAPEGWDGRFWLGVGLQDAGSGRRLSATILDRHSARD